MLYIIYSRGAKLFHQRRRLIQIAGIQADGSAQTAPTTGKQRLQDLIAVLCVTDFPSQAEKGRGSVSADVAR